MPSELAGFGIPAFFLAAITYLLAADFSVSKSSASRVPTPLGCAQGYQPIFQVGGKVDASVSSLLETRAKAIGKAERQLTDDAFRRMGVYVYITIAVGLRGHLLSSKSRVAAQLPRSSTAGTNAMIRTITL